MHRSAAPLLALALVVLATSPAVAKEWLEAELDAPIAMGTPGGTEIVVGLTVTVPEGVELHLVEGSSIHLTLTGPEGDTTRAAADPETTPGHYLARITIPTGGARQLEIGIPGAEGVPVMLRADPFAFGPVTARTAQLVAAVATPVPTTPTEAAADAGGDRASVVPSPPPAPGPMPLLGGALALGAAAGLAVALLLRRRAGTRRSPRSA